MKKIKWSFVCLALSMSGALSVVACGSSSDSACASASVTLCARACECGSPKCRFGDGSGASFEFDNQSACEGFLNLGCSGSGAQGVDFNACETDASAATCAGSGSGKAFPTPASCSNGQ